MQQDLNYLSPPNPRLVSPVRAPTIGWCVHGLSGAYQNIAVGLKRWLLAVLTALLSEGRH